MNLPWPAPLSANALADHLWQSTVFALGIWLLSFLLRNNQARIRYALWLAASFKFLLPFSLLITLGSLLPQPTHAVSATPETIYSAVGFATQPFAGWEPTAAAHHTPTRAEFFTAHLPAMLLALWITGALGVLLTWFIRWRSLKMTLDAAVPTHTGRELQLLRRVEAALPARSPLPLRLSAELIEPGIFGVFRPVLVWPERLTVRLDDEHIEAILTHELMHARRRDNLTAALHMFVEAALWFHPLVWWIGRRLMDERERACDEAVVQLGGRAEAYAESLLKACRFCIESPLPCVSGITGADLKQRVVQIMTERVVRKLTLGKKMLLASLAVVALSLPVLLGTIQRLGPVHAQTQGVDDAVGLPRFDVVSVRPAKADEVRVQDMPMDMPDGINAKANTVVELIRAAYGGREYPTGDRIVGAPEWTKFERFDVQARVSEADLAAFQKLSFDQRCRMLRPILEERFKLKVHRETRQVPVYELVIGKGEAKLKEAKADDVRPNGLKDVHGEPIRIGLIKFMGRNGIVAQATTMASFVNLLAQPMFGLGRPVVDKTGLMGTYDFALKWAPDPMGIEAPAPTDDSAPPIFTALREQLGLRLVAAKGPVEVLVIESVERPSEN